MISMMNRHFDLTRWILVLTASIIPFMAMAQQTDDDENNTEEELVPQPKGKPNYVLTMGIIPEGYPLAIKEKNASAIGTLQEYGRKPVLFTLKNISDKTIKIKHARASNSPRPYRTRRSRRRRSCPSISPSTPRISDMAPSTAS